MTISPDILIGALTAEKPTAEQQALLAALHRARHINIARSSLTERSQDGKPLLHALTEAGLANRIHPALLDAQTLEMVDAEGNNLIHAASGAGHLAHIPAAAQMPEHYLRRNSKGYAAIHIAAGNDQAIHIPPHVLRSTEVLTIRDPETATALHLLARNGSLDLVPPGLLTKEAIMIGSRGGISVAHEAAANSSILAIGHLVDMEVLKLTNEQKESVISVLADAGGLVPDMPPFLQEAIRLFRKAVNAPALDGRTPQPLGRHLESGVEMILNLTPGDHTAPHRQIDTPRSRVPSVRLNSSLQISARRAGAPSSLDV